VNGTDYDVTVFNDRLSPNDDRITEMPWWGNESLAEQFAIALGGPPYGGLAANGNQGPFFAYNVVDSGFFSSTSYYAYNSTNSTVAAGSVNNSFPSNFAIATEATPVPLESDALPVVGSALFMAGGLWWKKKRAQAKVAEFVAKK